MHNKKLYNKMFKQPKKEREHGTQPKRVSNALTHQAWNLRGTNQKVHYLGKEGMQPKGGVSETILVEGGDKGIFG
jgi:hypothetical protein